MSEIVALSLFIGLLASVAGGVGYVVGGMSVPAPITTYKQGAGGDGGDAIVVDPEGHVLMMIKGEPGHADGRGGAGGTLRFRGGNFATAGGGNGGNGADESGHPRMSVHGGGGSGPIGYTDENGKYHHLGPHHTIEEHYK